MNQEALIGRTIAGKYAIESLVGQGAMGAVYKARQQTLGVTLALKVLHRQLAAEPMFAARFLREAQAASRIDHPASMRVVDFGEEPDGLLYIVMEYVDGETLASILEKDGPLPVTRIVDIACQALAALAVAHDIGVVHRDIKPENIMVIQGADDEGAAHEIVKVCDFGVAKLLEGGARGAHGPSVTAEGLVVGTPHYMSPEQARGESLDARSDIYAMGVLLFQLMTGKVPFDSSTAFGTALMHVNDEPTRPRLLNPRVDSRLEKICLKAMRKRPEDRHASARELRAELRALLGHEDDEVAPASLPSGGLLAQIEAKPRRGGLVIAGAVLLATVVGGAYLQRRGAESPGEPVQSANVTSGMVAPAPHAATPAPAEASARVAEPAAAGLDRAEPARSSPPVSPPSRSHASTKAHARRAPGKAHGPASIAIGEDAVAPLPEAKAKAPGLQPADAKAPADAARFPALPPPDAAKAPAAAPPPDAAKVPAAAPPPDAARGPAAASPPDAARAPAPATKAPAPHPDPAELPLPVFPDPVRDGAP